MILASSKFLLIAACVLFIGSLTAYYYVEESGFNPNPQTAALPSLGICSPSNQKCPGFSASKVSLRVFSLADINSQQISFILTASASTPLARIKVYLDNVSLGAVEGPFTPGIPKLVSPLAFSQR